MNTFIAAVTEFYKVHTILSLYFLLILVFLFLEILFLFKAKWIIFKLKKKLMKKKFKQRDFFSVLIKDYKKILKVNFYQTDNYLFAKNHLEKSHQKLFRALTFVENSSSLFILFGLLAVIFITAFSLLESELDNLASLKNLYSNMDIIFITIVFCLICAVIIKIICNVLNIRDNINSLIENSSDYLKEEIWPQNAPTGSPNQNLSKLETKLEERFLGIEKIIDKGFNEINLKMDIYKKRENKSLKIMHTADIHIGLEFSDYPEDIANKLAEARFEVLTRLVNTANKEKCNIFVIAGDLFDSKDIEDKSILRVSEILNRFTGEVVLILPGNHDYCQYNDEFWNNINKTTKPDVLILNKYKAFLLNKFGLKVSVFPAYCDIEKEKDNRLNWIKSQINNDNLWQIGIAHGTLEDVFPDTEHQDFIMNRKELEDIKLDLWLIGHIHDPYPEPGIIENKKIYNAGTPEIDSEKRKYNGTAWIIDISEQKEITALSLNTGKYGNLIAENNK